MGRSTIASGHVSDPNRLLSISPIGFAYLREERGEVNSRAVKVDRNVRMHSCGHSRSIHQASSLDSYHGYGLKVCCHNGMVVTPWSWVYESMTTQTA